MTSSMPPLGTTDRTPLQALTFFLDERAYAVDIAEVEHVYRAAAFIPETAPGRAFIGRVDVHGRMVPVASMRTCLGHPERRLHPSEHFILAQAGSQPVMLIVDSIAGVSLVKDGQDTGPAEFATLSVADPAGTVRRLADGTLLIRDLGRLLGIASPNSGERFAAP